MTEAFDDRPTRGAILGAILATVGMTAVLVIISPIAAGIAATGILFILATGFHGSRFGIIGLVLVLVLSLLAAGIAGAPIPSLLAAGILAVTAWDMLEQGWTLGVQVGHRTPAGRSELVHGGSTLLVGAAIAGVLVALVSTIPFGWSVIAVLLAILAGLFAILALDAMA